MTKIKDSGNPRTTSRNPTIDQESLKTTTTRCSFSQKVDWKQGCKTFLIIKLQFKVEN